MADPPRIKITDFELRRDMLPLALAAGAATLAAAARMWDAFVPSVGLFVILGSNVVRRAEWRGRKLPTLLTKRSVFREGLAALPHDVVTLVTVAVVFPVSSLITAMLFGTIWAWIGVGLSFVIALGAVAVSTIAVRHRT